MADIKRSIAGDLLTEIQIDYTRPIYLVQIQFSSGTSYLSTGQEISYGGKTYISGQVRVNTFSFGADGEQTGSISLLNENNAAVALALNNRISDTPIVIYKTYLIAGGGYATPVLFVSGVLDSTSITPSSADVNVVSSRSRTMFIPKRYFAPSEGFNWLPTDGDVITWGEEKFILESEY